MEHENCEKCQSMENVASAARSLLDERLACASLHWERLAAALNALDAGAEMLCPECRRPAAYPSTLTAGRFMCRRCGYSFKPAQREVR